MFIMRKDGFYMLTLTGYTETRKDIGKQPNKQACANGMEIKMIKDIKIKSRRC